MWGRQGKMARMQLSIVGMKGCWMHGQSGGCEGAHTCCTVHEESGDEWMQVEKKIGWKEDDVI